MITKMKKKLKKLGESVSFKFIDRFCKKDIEMIDKVEELNKKNDEGYKSFQESTEDLKGDNKKPGL